MAGELVEFANGVRGMALNLEEDNVGVAIFGDDIHQGGRPSSSAPAHRPVPVGDALSGRIVDALGNADRRRRPHQGHRAPPDRAQGPRHHRPQERARADADRHQGHRRPHPHRPRPARADHRRPQDRQDQPRHRHHHQPARRKRALLLRGHRPEALHRGAGRRDPEEARRDGIHHHHRRHRVRPRAHAVPRALLRLRHGRVLPRQRPPRPDRLRRPDQAGPGLPPALAAAAPPPGPRSLSRRHLLSAQPPARTRGQDERRTAAAAP
jgi:hypothetical protein